jgi:hypothetical protein
MRIQVGRRAKWALGIAGGVATLAFLYFFSPEEFPFYPRCLLFTFTGLSCPGCGSLRAIHHLLHGEVLRAFQLNAMFVLAIPVGLVVGGWLLLRRGDLDLDERWLWPFIALSVLFGIARNL